jgi:hypothetical protein
MKKYIRYLIGAFLRGSIMVLAGDLLYFYYSGTWFDPIAYIEFTEVVVLYILGIASLTWTIYYMRSSYRKGGLMCDPNS